MSESEFMRKIIIAFEALPVLLLFIIMIDCLLGLIDYQKGTHLEFLHFIPHTEIILFVTFAVLVIIGQLLKSKYKYKEEDE
ncbi:hypothetical protein N9R04_08060 [Staphylococcus sp. SQ8-PEA]|uniref:Group-specific protein n=1 Tax=Staphylococcus marylandisciuri TaxID=2981529 RepID=A0ABT2QRR4_9STAP|nr:hypothetical protein [Staphylococcus marylandisciuri]MCU5746662.1 hypothetical protein [Staphylococcus marylandisciuri]